MLNNPGYLGVRWPEFALKKPIEELRREYDKFANLLKELVNDLSKNFFHSIMMYRCDNCPDAEILFNLESILATGYIYPYENIQKLGIPISRNRAKINGDSRISISISPESPYCIDHDTEQFENGCMRGNAYEEFYLKTISIVLSENLKEKCFLPEGGMAYERQIEGAISLDYMEAIAIPVTKKTKPLFESNGVKLIGDCRYSDFFDLEFLEGLRNLLDKYGYKNIPIIGNLYAISLNSKVRSSNAISQFVKKK